MNQPAVRFLNRCFAPDETIALLLRRENSHSITQRVVRLERALEPRYQAWLSYENGTGANIYVAANPLLPGTRKRTKESIASVRHLYIDIDTDGDARLAALRASDLVPPPTSILSTSPGKYQALWRVEGFDFDRQEQTLKRLAIAFGGDPACTDRNRVLRIPGFSIGSTIQPSGSRSNIPMIPSGLPTTSGWMRPRLMPCACSGHSFAHTGESTAIPKTTGHGFAINLPTVTMP